MSKINERLEGLVQCIAEDINRLEAKMGCSKETIFAAIGVLAIVLTLILTRQGPVNVVVTVSPNQSTGNVSNTPLGYDLRSTLPPAPVCPIPGAFSRAPC